jgi:hypothetical protein
MEAGSARLLNFRPARVDGRSRLRLDHLAEAKRENQRGVTEELLRRVTDIDPKELERLRVRAERKPDRITPAQEVKLHEAVRQLAGVRLKGAAEIDIKDPGSDEKLIVTAGSPRGGIQRIAHISPDHQEVGTNEGLIAIRPVYVPWFREIDGSHEEMFWQENTVRPLNDDGEPSGMAQVVSRSPRPEEIARLISLLRDGQVERRISYEALAEAEAAQAEA